MQCNCKEEMEAKLAEHVKAKLPQGFEDFEASLGGYTFTLGAKVDERFSAQYKGQVMVPKKSGGMKKQKVDVSFMAGYCPWCGERAISKKDEKAG